MDNIHFYGPYLDEHEVQPVIEFVMRSLVDTFKGTPIKYTDGMYCMAGDITLHVWGSPEEAHAEIIELTPPPMRKLN